MVAGPVSNGSKSMVQCENNYLRRLKRSSRTAPTTKMSIVPGHKNQPRSELYPPTTMHPGEKAKMLEIRAIFPIAGCAPVDLISLT